ncbi:MAG: TetR/AcrR family transcriptional regulator [Anaerolineaceae bacterium]|jgi:TetR/AcrR family transcriptional regulator|nr:TetR/AcrR family transcriptional regulator [Anaerolineaceae bacterium]
MDNRATLLDCALRLFTAQGYNAVGVQEIVEAAGVTKPTLYHYFGSKYGLLEILLHDGMAPLFEQLQNVLPYEGDLTKTLEGFARTVFQFALDDPQLYRLLLSLRFAPQDGIPAQAARPNWEKLHALLEGVFQQAVREHGNMAGRHRAFAATFLGMINTYAGLAFTGDAELNDELVYKAVHQFQHGIYS